jgi:hypothetical protein
MDKDKTRISLTYDQFVNLTWEEIEKLPEYQRKLKELK